MKERQPILAFATYACFPKALLIFFYILRDIEYMNTIPTMQTPSRDRSTTSFGLTGIKWLRMMRSCQAHM